MRDAQGSPVRHSVKSLKNNRLGRMLVHRRSLCQSGRPAPPAIQIGVTIVAGAGGRYPGLLCGRMAL